MFPMTTTHDSLIAALGDLGSASAPRTLLTRVLDATGTGARFAVLQTEIGELRVAWTAQGIRAVMRDVSDDDFVQWYARRFRVSVRRADEVPNALALGIVRELRGEGRNGLRFDLRGLTPFEQSVLQTALRIPRGEVRPYNWIAQRIGRPLAVRAVGTALAHNPIPFLIPCHRVVRADGIIGNYGAGGPVAKRAMLGWEGVDAASLETMARRGVRFVGSDTTHVFCYPTCRHARRITDPHRVGFGTVDAAAAAGYRACKDCTPVGMVAA
jgi:O-6-methylguanine DNA methyltransferase